MVNGLILGVTTSITAQTGDQPAEQRDISISTIVELTSLIFLGLGIAAFLARQYKKYIDMQNKVDTQLRTKNGHTIGATVDDIKDAVNEGNDKLDHVATKVAANETKLADHESWLERLERRFDDYISKK